MKQNQYSRKSNEIAREKLANILLFEMADPDLRFVTVTGVEVSVDHTLLRAYVSCDASRYDKVSAALARSKGRIRSLLGRALGWRVTPELDFRIDTTVDEGERIDRVLNEVQPSSFIEKDEFGYPIVAVDESASDEDGEELEGDETEDSDETEVADKSEDSDELAADDPAKTVESKDESASAVSAAEGGIEE